MKIETYIYDSSPCDFPRPRVPVLPYGLSGLNFRALNSPPPLSGGFFRCFSKGRYALREAYRLSGVGQRGHLLAPAYHCRTMLDPALSIGGEVSLYQLNPDLTPDLTDLRKLIDSAKTPFKAILVTHFFGIPITTLSEVQRLCRARGISLIEDCSHTIFLRHDRAPLIGKHGDFVISSPYKFVPSCDGGLLYTNAKNTLPTPFHPSIFDELKCLKNTLSEIKHWREVRVNRQHSLIKGELNTIQKRVIRPAIDKRADSFISPDYLIKDEKKISLRLSRLLHRAADVESIKIARCTRYKELSDALGILPGCRPLFPSLPSDCIPYMFPLLIERPDIHFPLLKHMGLPIWRWDTIAVSSCRVANHYRLHLLHLPCHQSLTNSDVKWMIEVIKNVMTLPTRGTST